MFSRSRQNRCQRREREARLRPSRSAVFLEKLLCAESPEHNFYYGKMCSGYLSLMIRAVLRLSVFFRVGRAWPARLFLKSVHFESAHSADKSSANKHSFLSPYHMCAILRDLASHYIGTRDCEPPRIEKTILDSSLIPRFPSRFLRCGSVSRTRSQPPPTFCSYINRPTRASLKKLLRRP